MSQLSFADIELGLSRKPSRISLRLDKINTIVDWGTIYGLVKDIDYILPPFLRTAYPQS